MAEALQSIQGQSNGQPEVSDSVAITEDVDAFVDDEVPAIANDEHSSSSDEPSMNSKEPKRRKRRKDAGPQDALLQGDLEQIDGYEEFFVSHSKKDVFSANRVSTLPTFSAPEFVEFCEQEGLKVWSATEALSKKFLTQRRQWLLELDCGFSLLFYGHGSKRELLLDFVVQCFPRSPRIVINGYFQGTNIRHILLSICSYLQLSKRTGSVMELIRAVQKAAMQLPNPLVLLLNNIDAGHLQADRSVYYLSLLAACSNIYFIASTDHVSSGILFDSMALKNFNLVYHDVATYTMYATEMASQIAISGYGDKSAQSNAAGVLYVLASLTPNARGIYRTMVEFQLEVMMESHMDDSIKADASHGIDYVALYEKCASNFLVSNDMSFRTQLTEFKDHKMIVSRHDQTGTEILYIPFSKKVLEEIIDDLIEQ